jgi:hypothetical protein
MATPLSKKLDLKPGQRLLLVDAPPNFLALLDPLPDGPRITHAEGVPAEGGLYEGILVFALSQAALREALPVLMRLLTPAGMLWACWPKKASKVPTDLADGFVRQIGLDSGLVDVKVCAIDATWSGLKFVYRLQDRPPADP